MYTDSSGVGLDKREGTMDWEHLMQGDTALR